VGRLSEIAYQFKDRKSKGNEKRISNFKQIFLTVLVGIYETVYLLAKFDMPSYIVLGREAE
jgi:hypothetical protein